MKQHDIIKEVKIVSKMCEDAGKIYDHPQKFCELWSKVVESSDWHDPEKESVVVFNLNTKLGIKSWQMVAVGTINEVALTPREVFRSAVASLAHSIVVMHNHPTGNPSPSPADLEITRRLRDGGKVLSVTLQDHIIVGDGKNGNPTHYSFREAGYV